MFAVLEYRALRLQITEYGEGPREKQILGPRCGTRGFGVPLSVFVFAVWNTDYGVLKTG
ncbi:hypothetical protein [Vibrio mytili]|uniref:hypothetical protein n=1 Tax=Vibrio mytili TaxID=50718 RepID=UPI0013E30F45|nr:hypothetical protein [Vibrio mytili]